MAGIELPDLEMLIQLARALGLKLSIVVYNDGDAENCFGPIPEGVFRGCWEASGKPRDYFDLEKIAAI